jgi:hypothetical protein
MVNVKRKGYEGEIEYRNLLRKIFGVKVERQFASGAFTSWKGDINKGTLPEVLKDYPPEIKYTAKAKPFEWIAQCQREFNSKTGWHIAWRIPAVYEVPENFIVMIPAIEFLGLMKELQELREVKK